MDFLFLRQGDAFEEHDGSGCLIEFSSGDLADFFGLGALDAHERCVAKFVAAGLDGEDGGSGQFDGLEPAFFEFALDVEAGVGFLDVENERGMGQTKQLGHDDAGLAVAKIVGLQAGEDEVGIFGLDGRGEQSRDAERVALAEIVASMWMPRSAPLARASRMVDPTRSGPALSTTTSPPCFSLSCSASSSA